MFVSIIAIVGNMNADSDDVLINYYCYFCFFGRGKDVWSRTSDCKHYLRILPSFILKPAVSTSGLSLLLSEGLTGERCRGWLLQTVPSDGRMTDAGRSALWVDITISRPCGLTTASACHLSFCLSSVSEGLPRQLSFIFSCLFSCRRCF